MGGQLEGSAGAGHDGVPHRGDLDPLAAAYLAALLDADRPRAVQLVMDAVDAGRGVRELYEDVLTPVQQEIGRMWQRDEITVAIEHYCTAVTQLVVAQLQPRVFATPRNGLRLVATSAQGNLHELGIRMVSDIFELEGWDTYYLGANTPHAAVVEAVAVNRADLLLASASMSRHVESVRGLVAAVRADERTRHVPVLVGGAPFAGLSATDVGADVVVNDVSEGLRRARELAGRAP